VIQFHSVPIGGQTAVAKQRSYAIVLEPQPEGGFTVTVPALPEVVTEGDTEEEALTMAREAIELAIAHRRSKGLDVPTEKSSMIRRIKIGAAA
jgi:antitoxin HicB